MTINKKNNLVYIDVKSFERTRFDLIVGIISFNLYGYYFPDEKWYDFPVRLLGWWLHEILTAISEKKNMIDLSFMDGPFKATIKFLANDIWEIECIERGKQAEKQIYLSTIGGQEFIKSIIKKSGLVIRYCDELGLENDDVTFLKARFEEAKEIF